MNQTVEKWLAIGALVGWVASIGSLVGLAVRVASPAIGLRPVQNSSLFSASRNNLEYRSQPQQSRPLVMQREIAASQIPFDTSKGYWVDSLNEQSNSWIDQRSR